MKYQTMTVTRRSVDIPALNAAVGRLIRREREAHHETGGQIADVVGLTRASVSNMELGNCATTLATLYNLAAHWDIPVAQLLPK